MGITIYQHVDYKGKKSDLSVGDYPKSVIGNDQISSIKIQEGYYVMLYKDTGFRGPKIVLFEGDYSSLPGWNDKISSIKVFKQNSDIDPLVTFYEHNNFKGYKQKLAGLGQETDFPSPFFKHDTISSLKIPEGVRVVLYEHHKFGGKSLELGAGDHPSLKVYGFNDIASSVKLIRSDLELVSIKYENEVSVPAGDPIGISGRVVSYSAQKQSFELNLTKEIESSITRSWSETTLVGLEVSVTSEAEADLGLITASSSTTISTKLEQSFTIGEEETHSEVSIFGQVMTVSLPPYYVGEGLIILTPVRKKIDAIYTFRIIDTDRLVEQTATILIDDFQQGEAEITTRPIDEGEVF
jgi:hypothetical protein